MLCALAVDVGADSLDLLVPRALEVVPPDRELPLTRLGRCAELVRLGLRGGADGLDVLLEVGSRFFACGCNALLCLLRPGGQFAQLLRCGHLVTSFRFVFSAST